MNKRSTKNNQQAKPARLSTTKNTRKNYNKDLDEDNMEHSGSQGGFEEFDEYEDEKPGSDYEEYNSRDNEDRAEVEEDALHLDTETGKTLSGESMERAPIYKDLKKTKPGKTASAKAGKTTRISKSKTPYTQTESEGDNSDISEKSGRFKPTSTGAKTDSKKQAGSTRAVTKKTGKTTIVKKRKSGR